MKIKAVLCILLSACVLSACEQERASFDEIDYPLLSVFYENYDKEVIYAYEMDLNDDGRTELLVVYRESKKANKIVAVFDGDSNITEPIPAPFENVLIEEKDIDEKPPNEFILSGSKGTSVGYGIYRYEDGKLVDLFGGENMKGCC